MEFKALFTAGAAMRVLVVDDCRDTTSTLEALLGHWGHQAAVANDGATALSLAASFRPEVALVDLMMPGMRGDEVARALRALPGLGLAAVVALTAWTGAIPAGDPFTCRLVKPVAPGDLRRLLEGFAAEGRELFLREVAPALAGLLRA